MRAVLDEELEATVSSWPEIRAAFGWVRRFAAVLANANGLDATGVRRRRGLIGSLARRRKAFGGLAEEFDHFRKVTGRYWTGLFRCYEVMDLPRTNNDPERFFCSYRSHERRCSG